ncbi:MAG TPA: sodium:proton exchanger, partial [Gammaproteobacteria bacterium]|nr:sodium:proton exchanger [Gammaproteobacteria bacterium]
MLQFTEISIEQMFMLGLALIIFLGMLAQWLAWRFRVPSIILLFAAGIIVGPVLGILRPSEQMGNFLQTFIGFAVAIILFDGGLNLRLFELKQAAKGVIRLVTVGPIITLVLVAAAAHWIANLSWAVSFIFSSITVVTGPTVIMPLLRHANLTRRPASYLKWEGIVNDPVGALLAVLFFEFAIYSEQISEPVTFLLESGIAIGASAILGAGSGYFLGHAYERSAIPEFLKSPVLVVAVVTVYALANLLQEEAGLLAVTLMGMVVGNVGITNIYEIRRFKESLVLLLVSALFILLSADLNPEVFTSLAWPTILLIAIVLFIVRPVSVFLSTIRSGMSFEEKLLIGWIAPRGIVAAAVAGVFAPKLVEHGYPEGGILIPLVFLLIVVTVVLHGFSLSWLANRLGLASRHRNGLLIIGANVWTIKFAKLLKDIGINVLLIDSSWAQLKNARLAGIPVYYGEILSEASEETLDLVEIGQVLSASVNDSYNALVSTYFIPEFGRDSVFQLNHEGQLASDKKQVSGSFRGMVAFDEEITYEALIKKVYQDWRFSRTKLSDNFGLEEFREERGSETLILAVIKGDG